MSWNPQEPESANQEQQPEVAVAADQAPAEPMQPEPQPEQAPPAEALQLPAAAPGAADAGGDSPHVAAAEDETVYSHADLTSPDVARGFGVNPEIVKGALHRAGLHLEATARQARDAIERYLKEER